MLKTLLRLSVLLAVMLLLACSKSESDLQPVPYQLPYNISLQVPDEEPIAISSKNEFNTVFGEVAKDLPSIDFSKYNLIYLQGKSSHSVTDLETIWNTDVNPYKLYIHVQNNNITNEYRCWGIAYLLSKDLDKNIQVSISYN